MQALKKIDWELLGEQKLTLVELLDSKKLGGAQRHALEGILNLLDEMTDENYHNHLNTLSDEDYDKEVHGTKETE